MPSLADQIRSQYRTSLGRDASDDEVTGWTSGRYGGGGINDWTKQIAGSDEARRRPQTTASPTPNVPMVAPTTPRPSTYGNFFQTQGNNNAETIIRNAYKTYTGRDADDAGLRAHLNNPGGAQGAVKSIYDSDEAKKYWDDNQQAPPAATTTTNTTNGPAAAVTPQKFQGFAPKYAMEGFDTQREQDTGKSAKDAFAYLSNQAPPPPINDKAALGEWFNQYIAPGMNALGHKVLNVVGDQVTLSNWQGTGTIDFARGAGADGGALAWQLMEDTYDPSTGGEYVPQAPAAQTQGATTTDPTAPVVSTTPTAPDGTPLPPPPPGYRYDDNGQLVPDVVNTAPDTGNAQPLSSTMRYRYLPNDPVSDPQPSI